jgi:hypothetical protein
MAVSAETGTKGSPERSSWIKSRRDLILSTEDARAAPWASSARVMTEIAAVSSGNCNSISLSAWVARNPFRSAAIKMVESIRSPTGSIPIGRIQRFAVSCDCGLDVISEIWPHAHCVIVRQQSEDVLNFAMRLKGCLDHGNRSGARFDNDLFACANARHQPGEIASSIGLGDAKCRHVFMIPPIHLAGLAINRARVRRADASSSGGGSRATDRDTGESMTQAHHCTAA